MRLKLERFGLPNKPTGTPERLEKPIRCGDWGRAPALPLAPNPEATPQSACGGRLPPSHRNGFSSRSGVAHGLFPTDSALRCL